MKKSSSYISIYKRLVFESDHSMKMTVLLFSVWLHNVQVTICCFFPGGGRDPPLLFYILNLLLISFILLPVQLSECTYIFKSSDICQWIFFAVEEKVKLHSGDLFLCFWNHHWITIVLQTLHNCTGEWPFYSTFSVILYLVKMDEKSCINVCMEFWVQCNIFII